MQERFGAIDWYINDYRAVFDQALDGEALAMLRDAREQGYASCLFPPLSFQLSCMSLSSPPQPFSDVT